MTPFLAAYVAIIGMSAAVAVLLLWNGLSDRDPKPLDDRDGWTVDEPSRPNGDRRG